MAMGRGLLRAMSLGARAQAASAELDAQREAFLADAVPTLQSYSGQNEPGRGRPSALEGLAAAAYKELRDSDQSELQELAESLAERREGAAGRLGRRAMAALYRDEAIRQALSGARTERRSASRSPAPLLGVLVLTGMIGGVGYFATRPRVDLEPPQMWVEAPGEVTTPSLKLKGEVLDDDLASLELDGRPVSFPEGTGHYPFALALEDLEPGEHTFELVATDRGGRRTSRSLRIKRVPAPAQIEITEPALGFATREGRVEVRGRVLAPYPLASVRVGSRNLALDEQGEFHGQLELPAREGPCVLSFSVETPTLRGEATREVLVDRTPPILELLEPGAKTYGTLFDLPLRVVDASALVTLEVDGQALPPFRSGRDDHVALTLPGLGRHVLELRARDAAGNASAPRRLEVECVAPSEGGLARFRTGERSYKVTEDVVVPAGQVLVIPPGSRIEVRAGKEFRVEGELRAPGSPSGTIQISGTGWGGLRLKGEAARADLRYVELRGGLGTHGGVLSVFAGARASLQHCTFVSNVGSQHGGALYAVGKASAPAQLELRDVTFVDNSCAGEGGAINLNSYCVARLERVEFRQNKAETYGGALVLIGLAGSTTEAQLEACSFKANAAANGGALQVGRNARARLSDCVFEENLAEEMGGGVLLRGRSAEELALLELRGGRMLRNRSKKGGGALAVQGYSSATVSHVDLEENSTGVSGGAVLVRGQEGRRSALSLVESHFVKNRADATGGALAVGSYAELHADRTLVKGNVAGAWGGGLFAQGEEATPSRVDFVGCRFEGNWISPRPNVRLLERGDALRIGPGVAFDTQTLGAAGITAKQASFAAGVWDPSATPSRPAPAAVKSRADVEEASAVRAASPPRAEGAAIPEPPAAGRALLQGEDDDFGRALGHYVAAALTKNYLALRDRPYRHGSSRFKSYYAKVEFPSAVSTRIWDSGTRHYACVILSNTAPDAEATEVFERCLERLKSHLGEGWTEKHHETKRKGRVFEFTHEGVRLRLTLTRYEVSAGTRATVMLFFN